MSRSRSIQQIVTRCRDRHVPDENDISVIMNYYNRVYEQVKEIENLNERIIKYEGENYRFKLAHEILKSIQNYNERISRR